MDSIETALTVPAGPGGPSCSPTPVADQAHEPAQRQARLRRLRTGLRDEVVRLGHNETAVVGMGVLDLLELRRQTWHHQRHGSGGGALVRAGADGMQPAPRSRRDAGRAA